MYLLDQLQEKIELTTLGYRAILRRQPRHVHYDRIDLMNRMHKGRICCEIVSIMNAV